MTSPRLDAFQVIADPSRRQMLQLLMKDSMTINNLAANFEMSRPAVSKHVKALHDAGFIMIEDKGRERYCSLKEDGFRALKNWINYFDKFWIHKLQQLDTLLNQNIKQCS